MAEENRETSTKTNFWLGFFAGMAILAVVAFFVLLIVVFSNKQPVNLAADANTDVKPEQQQAEQPSKNDTAPVPGVKDGEKFLGGKDAKAVLIEYTDLECPYCSKQHATVKQILSIYGNKIKYVLRHFPLTSIHPDAQKAAEAVECATEQNKRFEMVDYIFDANAAKTMSVDSWKAGAKKLGLNVSKFNDCLDSDRMASAVEASAQEGGASGVDGTPATFINGQLVSGAVPFDSFKGMIDSALK